MLIYMNTFTQKMERFIIHTKRTNISDSQGFGKLGPNSEGVYTQGREAAADDFWIQLRADFKFDQISGDL
jgi:hypothetical protein